MRPTVVTQAVLNLITSSSLFDAEWYQQRYPDVGLLGMSPVMHYLLIGSKLQRDPGPAFNSRQYVLDNPTAAGKALLHYLLANRRVPLPAVTQPLFSASAISRAINLQEEVNGEWQSVTDDPQFHFALPGKSIPAGYYLLELQLNADGVAMRSESKLYIDYGQGFTESDVVVFSVPFNTANARVIYLHSKAKSIRFDPLEVRMHFRLATFNLGLLDSTQLSEYFADVLLSHKQELPDAENASVAAYYQAYDGLMTRRPGAVSYEQWIAVKEQPALPSAAMVQQQLALMHIQPMFSVVMPTYNTDATYLRACIESVLQQSYPNWELCIADDKSPKPHVVAILDEYSAKDPRIKVVKRQENGHISRASNSAIELASGEYIALLDHDDLLAKDALYFMAEAVNQYPDGQIFYSDEDKIDLQGRRSEPHF